jgi:hypothetical protein
MSTQSIEKLSLASRIMKPITIIGAVALTAALAGCGSSGPNQGQGTATATATPAAYTTKTANPVAAPPLGVAALEQGSTRHQITEAIVTFYRGAFEDDATAACGEFSPAGVTGFMHAAKTAFPQSINRFSTCVHAMEIYSAALGESVSTAQDNDPSFNASALDNVGVEEIRVHGDSATTIAPTNAVEVINPEQIILERLHGRWLIEASHSLNKSNLPAILAKAKAEGKLKPHK